MTKQEEILSGVYDICIWNTKLGKYNGKSGKTYTIPQRDTVELIHTTNNTLIAPSTLEVLRIGIKKKPRIKQTYYLPMLDCKNNWFGFRAYIVEQPDDPISNYLAFSKFSKDNRVWSLSSDLFKLISIETEILEDPNGFTPFNINDNLIYDSGSDYLYNKTVMSPLRLSDNTGMFGLIQSELGVQVQELKILSCNLVPYYRYSDHWEAPQDFWNVKGKEYFAKPEYKDGKFVLTPNTELKLTDHKKENSVQYMGTAWEVFFSVNNNQNCIPAPIFVNTPEEIIRDTTPYKPELLKNFKPSRKVLLLGSCYCEQNYLKEERAGHTPYSVFRNCRSLVEWFWGPFVQKNASLFTAKENKNVGFRVWSGEQSVVDKEKLQRLINSGALG